MKIFFLLSSTRHTKYLLIKKQFPSLIPFHKNCPTLPFWRTIFCPLLIPQSNLNLATYPEVLHTATTPWTLLMTVKAFSEHMANKNFTNFNCYMHFCCCVVDEKVQSTTNKKLEVAEEKKCTSADITTNMLQKVTQHRERKVNKYLMKSPDAPPKL